MSVVMIVVSLSEVFIVVWEGKCGLDMRMAVPVGTFSEGKTVWIATRVFCMPKPSPAPNTI